MSASSDGNFNGFAKMVQERLEKGISQESKLEIERILACVNRLTNLEKLLLYLRLPTELPVVNTPVENTKSCSNYEEIAEIWIKTHLMRNENTSVLRKKVYEDYREFCDGHQFDSVSIAEFKKMLQSVFPGLTIRRLGKRGSARHMFGGISYLQEPVPLSVPDFKVEKSDEDGICDEAFSCDDGDEKDAEVVARGGDERTWERTLKRSSSSLVLEWAYKLLNVRFQSLRHLAEHLLSRNYVSQVSAEAFTLAASAGSDILCKESSGDVLPEVSSQKPVHARHQLQKKLQERREIIKQKQRMEEERNHLTNRESASSAVTPKSAPPTLPGSKPQILMSTRTAGLKPSCEDRNPRKPPVATILPKTLLPKLPVNSATGQIQPQIFGLDFDPTSAKRVEPPQFLFLSPSSSHFQSGPSSLFLISSTLAPNAPAVNTITHLQGVKTSSSSSLLSLQQQQHQPLDRCDLRVISSSSENQIHLPAAAASSYVASEGSYSYQITHLPPPSDCSSLVSSACPSGNAELHDGRHMMGNLVKWGTPKETAALEGSVLLKEEDLKVIGSEVQMPAAGQESQPRSSSRSLLASKQVEVLTSDAGKEHSGISATPSVPQSAYSSNTVEIRGRSEKVPSAGDAFALSDDVVAFGDEDKYINLVLYDEHETALSSSESPYPSQHEPETKSTMMLPSTTYTVSGFRSAVSVSNGAGKVKSRNLPSRTCTKTVSSILDEQRKEIFGSRATKFYNDSRNVSQILKELREKNLSTELHESDQGTLVADHDKNKSATPYFSNPVVGLAPPPPKVQILQVLPRTEAQRIILDVQSSAKLHPIVPNIQSSQPVRLQYQAFQSAKGLQFHGMPPDPGLRPSSSIGHHASGVLPEGLTPQPVIFSGNPFLHLQQVIMSPCLPKTVFKTGKRTSSLGIDSVCSSIHPAACPSPANALDPSKPELESLPAVITVQPVVPQEVGPTVFPPGSGQTSCTVFSVTGQQAIKLESSDPGLKSPQKKVDRSNTCPTLTLPAGRMNSEVRVCSSNLQRPPAKPVLSTASELLQSLMMGASEASTSLAPVRVASSASCADPNTNTYAGEINSILLGRVGMSGSRSEQSRARPAMKRCTTAQSYGMIKKLLMGDNQRGMEHDRELRVTVESPSCLRYEMPYPDKDSPKIEEQHLRADDQFHEQLDSPGEKQEMPYKNSDVQHCTLQQLSLRQEIEYQRHANAAGLSRLDAGGHLGSRPASAFGDAPQGLGQGPLELRPSRPNTVAVFWDDHGADAEADVLQPYFGQAETGRHCPSGDSSERSTPMSVLSPRSNISSCSLYTEQPSTFMPIHISDTLPTVTAIKPLPQLGLGCRSQMELDYAGITKQDNARVAVTFASVSGSFAPYTNADLHRSVENGRLGGFAPVSSIKPVKRIMRSNPSNRQRHHSAHDIQEACNKILPFSNDMDTNWSQCSSLSSSSIEPFESLPSVRVSSGFGGVMMLSSDISASVSQPLKSQLNVCGLTAADEVEEIILASQETLGLSSQFLSHRSQSEPAKYLLTNYPYSMEEAGKSIFPTDGESVFETSDVGRSSDRLVSRKRDKRPSSSSHFILPEGLSYSEEQTRLSPKLSWNSTCRGDHLIGGTSFQPLLAFAENLHCDVSTSANLIGFAHSSLPSAYINEDCTPPLSQNPSPEFEGEIPFYEKPNKDMFPLDCGPSAALDTPSSLEGLFSSICGDDNEGHDRPTPPVAHEVDDDRGEQEEEDLAHCDLRFDWV